MKPISETSTFTPAINSQLSFRPLLSWWKEKLPTASPLQRIQLEKLIHSAADSDLFASDEVEISSLKKYQGDFSMILNSLFPVSIDHDQHLFLMAMPFDQTIVYSSSALYRQFITPDGCLNPSIQARQKDLYFNKLYTGYKLIFKKFYDIDIKAHNSLVYRFIDAEGIEKYYYSEINTDFIDIELIGDLPSKSFIQSVCPATEPCLNEFERWQELIPLDNFLFKGFSLVYLKDFTSTEAVSELNNELLKEYDVTSPLFLDLISSSIKSLLGTAKVMVGIAALQKFDDEYLITERRASNSLLINQLAKNNDPGTYQRIVELLGQVSVPVFMNYEELIQRLEEDHLSFQWIAEMGVKELIIVPLYYDQNLVGVLEICSTEEHALAAGMLEVLKPIQQPLAMTMQKERKNFEHQVQHIIRKNYTAIQPVIEWKFNEVAVKKLMDQENGQETSLAPVVFDGIYPLYAAVDIRNSSSTRIEAIQQDLRMHLGLARTILGQAHALSPLPVLEKMDFRIGQMLDAIQLILVPEDEAAINHFILEELNPLFRHLKKSQPSLQATIAEYFAQMDPGAQMMYKHRQAFEDSLEAINVALGQHIDKAQIEAQRMFPHYFEKYKTDGIDYNIYIGQSLVKDREFDQIYLENLRLWQLTVLCECAFISQSLKHKLPVPLETTQLLLAHSNPLSISFRMDERQFDVEGAYNIRYEILKKRIDKALIKGSNERLTQPGSISVIYSHPLEAKEYLDYIHYLQTKGMLGDKVEHLDLEDLQGVNGLKAIRVKIASIQSSTLNSEASHQKENSKTDIQN
ncbi:GAF domain-containing protein [Echinicola pacifica]|uniref:GAF domain-containing protein n=1 Tax=Echinicola pacifica TaxID=346377 RepID=UPI0012F80E1B|nr:GAF domain-containing protein [Echinicola pacifica]